MSLLNNLEIEEIVAKNEPHSSSFVFHHLPSGMGITLGNYLRHFLLKYNSGIAPLGAKISDKNGSAESEFSVLSGVKEVTSYLIINLKKIIVEEKKKKEGIFCLELSVENKEKKEKVITASDFQKDKEVEIKNPDLYLATLAASTGDKENPRLEIKLYFQKNWGYHEEEEQEKKYFAEEEDVIAFDTDYSPIKGGSVNFKVNSQVISQKNAEEELVLTITTNGAIAPRKALQETLELSKNSFSSITELINSGKKQKITTETK